MISSLSTPLRFSPLLKSPLFLSLSLKYKQAYNKIMIITVI